MAAVTTVNGMANADVAGLILAAASRGDDAGVEAVTITAVGAASSAGSATIQPAARPTDQEQEEEGGVTP